MPWQHPWRDLIFPQVPGSHLLENYVVASPQGSPTRRMRLSSVGVQVSNLLCLKVRVCAHSQRGLDSDKRGKKINRKANVWSVEGARVCGRGCKFIVCALSARVCVCASDWSRRRRSSAARVPSLMGLSGGMKGGDKRRGGGGKVKAGDGSLRREEHRSLDRTRKEAAEWRKIWLHKIRGAVAAV